MLDVALHIGGWMLVAFAASPIVAALGMEVWEGAIKTHLVPAQEIERLAEEIFDHYSDEPEQAAFREEQYYRYRCDSFEQWKWHRVRREITRRLNKLDRDQACLPLPPSAT